jgi:transposase, IS5 family
LGHDADRARIILSGQKRGITPVRRIRRTRHEQLRHNAIEPDIGHMKSNGRVGRNSLLGITGDATNFILAAAGHSLRLLLGWLAWLLASFISLAIAPFQISTARQPQTARV